MRTIACAALLLVITGSGCFQTMFQFEKPAPPPPPVKPAAKPPVTPERITPTNARQSAEAMAEELNRAESSER